MAFGIGLPHHVAFCVVLVADRIAEPVGLTQYVTLGIVNIGDAATGRIDVGLGSTDEIVFRGGTTEFGASLREPSALVVIETVDQPPVRKANRRKMMRCRVEVLVRRDFAGLVDEADQVIVGVILVAGYSLADR